jgi:PAS domain S-box-containing protein
VEPSHWPVIGGEMAHLVRTHDWAATPLGPLVAWPQSLRTAVDTCLGSGFASFVWWGRDLVQVYNDAALAIVRAKHPAAFAVPAREAWADVWQVVAPLVERVVDTGDPVLGEDMPMVPERGGPSEVAYFTFSYSALRDEAGAVAGMFITAIETTARVQGEAARRESERRLKEVSGVAGLSSDFYALLEAAPTPFVVLAPPDLRIVAVNDAYLRTTMTEREAILDRTLFDVFPDDPDDPNATGVRNLRASLERVLATRRADVMAVQHHPIRRPAETGGRFEERWWSPINTPVLGTSGEVAAIIHRVEDVTEIVRLRSESEAQDQVARDQHALIERLRESEERFRLMADAVPQIVWITDGEGRVEFFNKQWSDYTGVPYEATTAAKVAASFVHPDDVGPTMERFEEARRTGGTFLVEHRIRSKDGDYRWFLVRADPYRERGSRKIVRWFGASVDIHDRKLAEAALRESEEQLRLAVEAAGLGRWELVPESGEFYTSAICNYHLGLPADARPTHEGHFETIHPDDHEMIHRRLRRAVEESGEFEAEYRVLHPGGDVRRILSRARMLHNRGSGTQLLRGMTIDVTEARELEKERERARARKLTTLAEAAERKRISRELHDRVAHHMGVAHQSLELHAALAESAPERAAEKLDLARETTRLALDQTRALSAELKRLQEGELGEGLEAAFGALAESYVPDGVEVELSFSGDESAIPNPVGLQVYLAMREAVRNAVRHSSCSHIGITLGVRDGEVYGRVEDDGQGYDPGAVDEATPSWGVGLRSMRERTEMLGGSLRVESELGAGTRVELRVPIDGRRP